MCTNGAEFQNELIDDIAGVLVKVSDDLHESCDGEDPRLCLILLRITAALDAVAEGLRAKKWCP